MTAIAIRHLTKVFGKHADAALKMASERAGKADILATTGATLALRDVSLDIPSGGLFAVMGLSGSGKSTLIRHLNRLIEPSSGEVLFDGQNILDLDARALREFRRQSVSMVFQSFALLPHLSVIDNVAFGLTARGEAKTDAEAKAQQWIKTVGLGGYERAQPDALSGGMKQRVGLARALAVDTPVLLMDEAFSALDPLIRADMQTLLRDLQQKLGKTVVFVTHDLAEAARIADRMAILRDGEVVQTGTPREVFDHPADDYVARFVATAASPLS